VVKVAGMASRLVRGTAIACGVAAVAGAGFGYAVGEPVEPEDILPARTLPADVCARIGDVSVMLPKASSGTAPVTMNQGGTATVTCEAAVSRQKSSSFTSASVKVTITPYAGADAGAGQPPFTPEQTAKRAFDRSPMDKVPDRQYPTKSARTVRGVAGESFTVKTLVQRADIVVQVEYTANPIQADAAEQAVLVLADRAIWESK
jgi:hypothetical protein